MERALVVVEPTEGTKGLLAEAGALANGVGAKLVALHVTTEAEYDQDRKAMAEVSAMEGGTYDVSQARDGARQFAEELCREVLGDGIQYEAVGAVGKKADRVLRVAEERKCDHVFVAGRRRSPSGKAIFGDTAQQVILNFDGPVTVVTRE